MSLRTCTWCVTINMTLIIYIIITKLIFFKKIKNMVCGTKNIMHGYGENSTTTYLFHLGALKSFCMTHHVLKVCNFSFLG